MSDSVSKNILYFIQGKLSERELKEIIQKENKWGSSGSGEYKRKTSSPENEDL